MVGGYGLLRGHGEVLREFVSPEPAHLLGLVGFAISRFEYGSQIGGRNPVRIFARQQGIGRAEQAVDGNGQTGFVERFANYAGFDCFLRKLTLPSMMLQRLALGENFRKVSKT